MLSDDCVRVCVCPQSPSHKNKRQQQELIQELRRKQVKDSRHVYEGKDGAIEDIITGNVTTHPHVPEELCMMPLHIQPLTEGL